MDSKTNSKSTTLKSNPLMNTSTAIINNSNIDPKFLLSNFESNHRDFHFFTDSQGNTFTTRDIPASQQGLFHNWMLPIFSLPTPPQPHHLSIQNISNTNIFMNQVMHHISPSTSSNDVSTISGNITFAHSMDEAQSICSTSNVNPTTASQRNSNSTSSSAKNRHACDWPGCTWSFKRLEHLKRHMITHTGERKYTCSYPGCGKRFGRSDNFAAHYRTHNKATSRKSRGTAKSKNKIQLNNYNDTLTQQHNSNNVMHDKSVNDGSIPQNVISQGSYSHFCGNSSDN
ncbi:zinc finger C2H2 protein ECU08_0560-like [Rhizophagus clarus]|uniref:Zinc finger C2H2 protein ECU08_0560-like n=1 Tax=Rhizophagus clarus TaxID=94130 RepID=A0A8H3QGL1_9GLOM|nr:zinc finger C2H2 protein ECU08_0560-like [Rhizophagus clarus]